ncbi:hypothetical protein [Methylomicrobium lacus]|uniref:hypothetical protein n=1 Tax=Methylomicrobium lacus TaxID=136992 RepID=UPI0035A8809D
MSSNITILKWLFALVLIFGGFVVHKIFGVLATDLSGKEYVWLLKLISEFGLFTSVVISVGFFHHWIIATEERRETEKMFQNVLTKYIDGTVINATKRGFVGITNKELDFSELMHGLYHGDYVYWLITFDPRYKHHCRELEHAIRKGVHVRMLILKDCPISEMCASEIIGYEAEEFRQNNRLFLSALEDIAGRIDNRSEGSLGVFVYDSLPSIPLFIILRNAPKMMEIYNSFYLSEPVGRMPYLHWQADIKTRTEYSFESANWNMPDLFAEYFQRRWYAERQKLGLAEKDNAPYQDFLYAPAAAKQKCTQLTDG